MTPYPLAWPDTLKRAERKVMSRFKTSLMQSMRNVENELRLFGEDSRKPVSDVVISSNVTLGVSKPSDTGVAVWFTWEGARVAIAVDQYPKVEDNLQAIATILAARRAEMRHGGLEIVRATMRGFTALPAPSRSARQWRYVLELDSQQAANPTAEIIKAAYQRLAKKRHPDAGGSANAMAELNRARDEALAEIGAK